MRAMIRIVLPFYSEFDTLKPSLRALRESDIVHEFQAVHCAFVAKGRNIGITSSQKRYQKLPAYISHYLILDSDIAFTVEQLRAALARDVDILGLPYRRHEDDDTYQTAWRMNDQGVLGVRHPVSQRGYWNVPFIGAGFLLVKREALEKMAYPWFHHRIVVDGDSAESCGEDVGFCLAAREAGLDIWCDFDSPVHHRLRRMEHFDVSY
jgi:hypothetical protein